MADLTEHELGWFLDPSGCPPLLGEDNPVQRMALEIRRHRAMVKRMEEWAQELECTRHVDDSSYGVHPNLVIAHELRYRMKGT